MRTLIGMAVAWAVAVLTAFLAGCIYAVTLMEGERLKVFNALLSGDKDASNILLFVGGATAIAAAVAALVAMIVLAWPLEILLRYYKHVSRRSYLIAGVAIGIVVALAIVAWEIGFNPLAVNSDYALEVISILVASPIAMVTLWLIVRPDRGHT